MSGKTRKPGAAEIATQLRQEISDGRVARNDRLPSERVLADRFGVARGTIRHALTRLAEERYVKVRPGSGTYVTHSQADIVPAPVEDANPLELIDTRFAIEPHVCRLSVLHGRRTDFDRLESLCTQMEADVADTVAFAEADTEFHRVLAESTGNKLLSWIIRQINSVRNQHEWTKMRQLTLDEEIVRTYNVQHRQILDALRAREPERAASFMKAHLETARLSLTRASET